MATLRSASTVAPVVLVLAGVWGGCSSEPETSEDDISSVPRVEVQPNVPLQPRRELHHISQGADILPYALLKALRVKIPTDTIAFDDDPLVDDTNDSGKVSFLDPRVQTRLRLLPDEEGGVAGLPVGLALGRAKETTLISVGINCAACHVAEWYYRTDSNKQERIRVYGAPNLFDISAWFAAVIDGLKHNFYRPSFWARVVSENAKIEATAGLPPDPGGVDAVTFMKDTVSWFVGFTSEADFFAKYGQKFALLRGRYNFIRGMVNRFRGPQQTKTGWGRLDMPNALKAAAFVPEGYQGASDPEAMGSASNGSWFFLSEADWFQVNANVSTPVLRDVAETFAAGGIIDMFGTAPTYETSINFKNNQKIDSLLKDVVPPNWPSSVGRNATRAARGEQIYREQCRDCHEARTTDTGLLHFPLVACSTIATDCGYARSYADTINGEFADTRLTTAFAKARDQYYKRSGIPLSQAFQDEDLYDPQFNPTGRRKEARFQFTDGYRAKPLDGMWATAPFLHNGSVPTLYALLTPPAQRPKKFYMGHRLYDMNDVGLAVVTEPQPNLGATTLFDTSLPGNGNGGHTAGTTLPEEDKRALIEFLKGFGAGRRTPTKLDGPLRKVPENGEATPKKADGRPAY